MIQSRHTKSYLRQAPLFAAIVRPVECQLITDSGPLEEPCLDLGCGDGLFASIAFQDPLSLGVDPDARAVRKAARRGAHRLNLIASGYPLPVRTASIATVLCNSVIEHIPRLEDTIAECARVLKPSGRLLITTPSHRFAEYLLIPDLLRQVGQHRPASAYERWFNRHSQHFHTDDIATWRERLQRAGFEVAASRYYLTRAAHRAFDIAHYLSVPRWAMYALTGRWVLAQDSPLQRFWARHIARFHANALAVNEGPYLFIDARKKL